MKSFAFFVLTSIFLVGCTPLSTASKSQKAYLMFRGDLENITIAIDHNHEFKLKTNFNNKYEVPTGHHMMLILRGNLLIEKRELFIKPGSYQLIYVPDTGTNY